VSFYTSVLRPLAFRLEPETAHNIGISMIRRGLVSTSVFQDPRLEQALFGAKIPNPLGLAAGFDKNAIALNRWHGLGFGFAEIGTVTFYPQPGNPKPRLFRLPQHKALINRMGFNNDGAAAVAERLTHSASQVPIGINLGKSKITEIADAADDYRKSYELLRGKGAYYVVNVSSPNTPGLRTLQEKGPLLEIVSAIRGIDPGVPLFVKVAPDLEISALDDVIDVAHSANLTGLIATNTTLSREGIAGPHAQETGGLSGAPVREMSSRFLSHLYKSCQPEMVLIGVGGIFTADDLYEKIALGAHLCQIYTGWIYGGPSTVPTLLRGLVERMEREGIGSLRDLRGSACP
jgi:dihydroorotate dehydrogenase